MAEVKERYGQIDILVNNAGIFTSCPVDETPLEQWQRVLDVNLTGVFLGCKHGVRARRLATRCLLKVWFSKVRNPPSHHAGH
jgi:NAD(P)-dependent dehydrogenase (short-subunit alcohol dehydrogenase family)